jgi:P4 family phage/plasmid primase-like protien
MSSGKKTTIVAKKTVIGDKSRQNIISDLWTFITDHIEKDTKKQTHMWFGDNFDKVMFRVEDENYNEFLDIVSSTTSNILNYANMEALHLTELPLEVGIFNIDLDIKFLKSNSHINFIEPINIIEKINNIVSKYFTLSSDRNELISYFLIKNEPFYDDKKKMYSDGIHISYPNLILNSANKNFILDLLIDELNSTNEFDELINYLLTEKIGKNKLDIYFNDDVNNFVDNEGNIVDILKEKNKVINSIFDRCVFNKTKWLMYGSGKETYKNKDVYKIKYIYDSECNLIDEEEHPNINELVKILAIRYPNKKEVFPNKRERPNHKSKEDILPNNSAQFVDASNKPIKTKTKTNVTNTKNDIEIAKKLIIMLNKDRATPYEMWRNVGLCLKNISDTLLPEFIDFSKKSECFDLEGCNNLWLSCKKPNKDDRQLTMSHLRCWAKEDNPDEYSKYYNEILSGYSLEDTLKINELLKNANVERDHEIALLIKAIYGHSFICSSIKTQSWYHYEKHRWNYCDAGYKLNNLISEHFTKFVYTIYKQLNDDHLKDISDETIIKKRDKILGFITKLNKTIYKKTLMTECANSFYEKNFINNLDENINLIGFENGVYDFKLKEFRDGLPEDRLTFSTGYNYNMDYTLTHPDIIELERIIKQIQPKDDVRQFMLCHIASSLIGGNADQKIVFWIGPGGKNGKSTIQNLISHALGRYYKYVDNTLITKERGKSNEASPDILELKGVRSIILSELEPGVKIHAGFFKRITGGDPLKGRDLFASEIIEYIPQFKPILISNMLPEFNSINDNAVWRRVCVIDFNQKFVDIPKTKNEHKIDNHLPIKLQKLKGAFMWLLLNKYLPIYQEYGLDALTPECVKEATNRAKTETEPYLKFSEEKIAFDEKACTDIDVLKTIYNDWHMSFYNKKATKPAGIIDYFVGEGCVKKGKNIIGIKTDLLSGLADDLPEVSFKSKLDE